MNVYIMCVRTPPALVYRVRTCMGTRALPMPTIYVRADPPLSLGLHALIYISLTLFIFPDTGGVISWQVNLLSAVYPIGIPQGVEGSFPDLPSVGLTPVCSAPSPAGLPRNYMHSRLTRIQCGPILKVRVHILFSAIIECIIKIPRSAFRVQGCSDIHLEVIARSPGRRGYGYM